MTVFFRRSSEQKLMVFVVLFAFVLRVDNVEDVPLSLDEYLTISRYVPLSLVDIFTTYHSNNQPMASALAHLFSPDVSNLFMLRWPMIIIGVLTLPFVFRLGTLFFNKWVGVLSTFLLAVAPVHLAYSIAVRGYGGLILLTAMSLLFLLEAIRYNYWRHWLGFFLVNILIIFFHVFGVLAAVIQVGLLGLWVIWSITTRKRQNAPLFADTVLKRISGRLASILLALLILYPLLIYSQTYSILSEGGHPAEFEVWRNGFTWAEDLIPLTEFLHRMAPMSPNGVGAWLYLALALVGLYRLMRWSPLAAVGLAGWFILPIVAIGMAMYLLGDRFYAYVRFLLYLLPLYLILVAAGIETSWHTFTTLIQNCSGMQRATFVLSKWGAVTGLVMLMLISINWYRLRSMSIDWSRLANRLETQLQPADIVICEERQRGFDVPNRAKPYCIWMLDFSVPSLTEYTPRFQSTVDFIAVFDNLQSQREAMLAPGGVWLVLWHKIEYNPSHLITNKAPQLAPPISQKALARYRFETFGNAILVYINSEETLLQNVRQAVQLLLEVENAPADQARYWRDLAEIELVQGRKTQALEYLSQSKTAIELAGGQYPELYLADTQHALDRVPDTSRKFKTESFLSADCEIVSSICLQDYDVFPTTVPAGQTLTLRLNWQVLDFVKQDYTFYITLSSQTGNYKGRLNFEVFDRTYPTTWWWPGQQLTSKNTFVLPTDLGAEDYRIKLGGYDRNIDSHSFEKPLFQMKVEHNSATTSWHIIDVVRRQNNEVNP